MLVKTFDAHDLCNEMIRCGRDNFSFYGYSELIDYFDSYGEPIECDPVAIDCEFNEDTPLNVWNDYNHLFRDFPNPDVHSDDFNEWCNAFVEELNWYTWAVLLDNGNIIYRDF